MKRKIRVTALFTALMMLVCTVSVFAYDPIWDEIENAGKLKGNANIKMDMTVESEGAMFAEVNGMSYTYDLNVAVNDDQTKGGASGTVEVKTPFLQPIKANVWVDYDFENENDFIYRMIIQSLSEITGSQIGDKYLVMDFSKIPQFKEMFSVLISLSKNYKYVETPEIKELKENIYSALDEIKPIKNGDTYTVSVSMESLKNIILNNRDKIIAAVKEISDKNNTPVSDDQLNKMFDYIEKLDVSGFDFSVKTTVKLNNGVLSDINAEMNIDIDLYELSRELGLSTDEISEQNKDLHKGKFSMKLNGKINPLDDDYKIDFPELNESNSIDVFDGLTAVYPGGLFGGEAASIGIIPSSDDKGGYNDIKIKYNGNEISFKNRPFVKSDRTFIALRELANMLGIPDENISYDEQTEKINISFGDVNIEMQIGSQNVTVNGKALELDVPVFTVNDRTYIPVRFISEMFGKNVDYSENDNILTVSIDG